MSVPVRIMGAAITGAYLGALLILWALDQKEPTTEPDQ